MKAASFSRKRLTVHLLMAVTVWGLLGCAGSPEAKSAKHMRAGQAFLQKKDAVRAALEFKTAAQTTPRNSEVYYQLGLAYLASGDIGKGVASLRKALELNPKHAMAQLSLAQLMTNATDPETLKAAQQRLQTLLQDNPENVDALHALALTDLKLGEPKEAMQYLERAIIAAPHELALAATLADAKLKQNDFKGAEEVLRKACEASPKSADCVVIWGRVLALENRLSEAEQKFQQAVGMDPKNAAGLLNLATLENAIGRKQEAEQRFQQLSSLPDQTFETYHAIFLFQEGRRDEAIKELEILNRRDPEDRRVRTRLAAAYRLNNRLADAQKLLGDALKKNPKDLEALLQRGEISLQDGKYLDAEADLNRVLHLRPDAPEVHYTLAKLHQARGATLRRREELNETLRLNPSLLQVRLELAAAMIRENGAKAALGILDGAPVDQKNHIGWIEQRNWAFLSAGKLAEARKGIEQGLTSSRTLDLLMQDAILKITEKHYGEARKSLYEAMANNPEDSRLLRLLVRSYAAQNQVPAAVQEVRAYAAKNPKSAEIQYFLGSLFLQTGARDQAKQAFLAAKAIRPDYAPADLSLAQIDLRQANWNDARRELTTILSKEGENPQARQWMGMLEVIAGNQDAAIANFRKVIETQPNNPTSLNNLAYLLADAGRADEALKYAQRAVELSPENPDFEDTLGWVLYRKGVYNAAVTHFKSAVSRSGGVRQQYHLAMAYFKMGDGERGRPILQSALRKDPNLPEAQLAQQVSREALQSKP